MRLPRATRKTLAQAGCTCANPTVQVAGVGTDAWYCVLDHSNEHCQVYVYSERIAHACFN